MTRVESRPRVMCVLGMHRSGTSAAAQILEALGFGFGPQKLLLDEAPDNPRGFFEHKPIVMLNNELLRALGGKPFAPPALPEGWETSPRLNDLRERGRVIADELLAGSDRIAWKDPRACLTLPFWQRLMPPMQYVICVRHPADVASSLRARNRVSRARAYYLWILHTRLALAGTVSLPRIVVAYDDMVDDPAGTTRSLADFAGHSDLDTSSAVKALELIDSGLRHHDAAAGRPSTAGRASTAAIGIAEEAYDILREGRLDDPEIDRLLAKGLDATESPR